MNKLIDKHKKLIEDLVSFLINHININLILVNENDKDNEYYILLSNYFLNIPLYVIRDTLYNENTLQTSNFYHNIYEKNKAETTILIYIIFSILYLNQDILIENGIIRFADINISDYTVNRYLSTKSHDIDRKNIYDNMCYLYFRNHSQSILKLFVSNHIDIVTKLFSQNKIQDSKLYEKINDINMLCLGVKNNYKLHMEIKCDDVFNYDEILNSFNG